VNVFLRELNAYRKSTIIWAASLSGIIIVFLALYPAFTTDITATREILSQFPPALRSALNISLGNFFTLYGFFGYLLGFAMLAASIQAMNLGVGVIAKEVSGKTADFLLSKPISRATIVTSKLGAALVMLLITNLVFWTVSFLAATVVSKEPFEARTFLLLLSTLLLVQLLFLALGALFAVVIPKVKSVVAVTLPTVFTFYIIGAIGDVLENDSVRYVSPFRFFDTNYIITNASLEGRYLAVEAAIIVIAVALAYVIYLKKDVRSST